MTPIDALHKLLLRIDPEVAHDTALRGLRLAQALQVTPGLFGGRRTGLNPRLAQTLLGAPFSGPIGLAAGFDKNGEAITALAGMGFSHLEVGTVTPKPQAGNPKPRLFRHRELQSLQNAMGFNNKGMEALAGKLASGKEPFPVPIGVNIGKNKATPDDRAEEDYATLFERFADLCDYFVVNVSSPNTPGLRDLQTTRRLQALVSLGLARTQRPILVKIAPDLEDEEIVDLCVGVVEAGAAGVILTNTTIDYSLVPGAREFGGLSGAVLRDRSRKLLGSVAGALFSRAVLVSVGGIDSAAEAYERLRLGASLLQVYTALVYQGPGIVGDWNCELLEMMERDGVEDLGELIGSAL